ncbi:WD40-repeat-containing domain protein [Phakopsora pachyrhizi]|nr:WD40-repeat-containing domain protein [Phakopsora pachyrhizi]
MTQAKLSRRDLEKEKKRRKKALAASNSLLIRATSKGKLPTDTDYSQIAIDPLVPTPLTPSSSVTLIGNSVLENGSRSNPATPEVERKKALIHRCRFVDYTPASITALACTPSTWDPNRHFGLPRPNSFPPRGVLAVGRGNGDIEIWVWSGEEAPGRSIESKKGHPVSQAWCLYQTLPGHVPSMPSTSTSQASKVEHLLFSHQVIPTDDEEATPEQMEEMLHSLPRLFGSNGADEVLEWEWDGPEAGIIKRLLPMPPSVAVWSLAVSPDSSRLAIGCDDGTIRLANIDNDQLEMIRKFDPCKTRLLSIAWGLSQTNNQKEPSDSTLKLGSSKSQEVEPYLVTGCADSSLRKWSLKTGRLTSKMNVDKLQGEQTLVWSIVVVGDTIISGDSIGNVTFWDSRSCCRKQTIRAHRADILCLAVSFDGNLPANIQSASIEPRGLSFQWILTASRRLHSHDVRAMVISPSYGPFPRPVNDLSESDHFSNCPSLQVPVLVSGGLDMHLVLCPAAPPPSSFSPASSSQTKLNYNPISDSPSVTFSQSVHRRISYVTHSKPVVTVSRGASLMACRNSQKIDIWSIKSSSLFPEDKSLNFKASSQDLADAEDSWRKVTEMYLKCQTNLIAFAISPDGHWLVISDLYEVKLFLLVQTGEGNLKPRKVKDFDPFKSLSSKFRSQGASFIQFTPDSQRLVLASTFTKNLVVMSLDVEDHSNIRVLRKFKQHHGNLAQVQTGQRPIIKLSSGSIPTSKQDKCSTDEETVETDIDQSDCQNTVTILSVALSPDGQWLASCDSSFTLHIFDMDSMKHHCYIPMPNLFVSSLAFSPSMPSTLLVGFTNNSLQIINVETRSVPSWASWLCSKPPDALSRLRDSILGMTFAPISSNVICSDDVSTTGSQATPIGGLAGSTACSEKSSRSAAQKSASVAMIWGATWVCKMSILEPNRTNLQNSSVKRRRNNSDLNNQTTDENDSDMGKGKAMSFKVTHKYQPLILIDYLSGEHEMVAVERPFFGLLSSLPPTWQRTGVYGT